MLSVKLSTNVSRLGVTTLCGAGDIITAHTVCDTAAAALSLYGVRGEYGMTSPARPATESTVLATPNQRSRPTTVYYRTLQQSYYY